MLTTLLDMFMADLLVALPGKLSDQKPIHFVTEIHARTRAWAGRGQRVEEEAVRAPEMGG